jgi:CRP/FNR family cyclic AMP-dependent transcriptional regulator
MTTAATRFLLQRNALFRDLPDATLDELVQLSTRRSYKKDSYIFMHGDQGDALYGVVSGRIRISSSSRNSDQVFLNVMEPGDSFGEIALLDGQPRSADAVAVEDTNLVVIMRPDFLQLLKKNHELTIHLLQLCCQRVRWTSELIEDSAFLSSHAHLAKRLIGLARLQGEDTATGKRVKINQSDLANFLSTSRQLVNQFLQEWSREGWVELGRGNITITDEQALQNLIEND